LQSLNSDGSVEIHIIANLFSLRLEDILSLDLSDLNLVLILPRKAQATKLEEDDLVPGELKYSYLQVINHLFLNLRALREELIRSVLGCTVRDNVEDNTGKDGLLLGAVRHVDVVNTLRVDPVLQRNLEVELQSVLGAALDHRHSRIRSLAELNGVHLDIVALE
jgi:hypothetical protein